MHVTEPTIVVPQTASTDRGKPNQEIVPWLVIDDSDPPPKLPWYTPARYFARELVKSDSTLLLKKDTLADKVSASMFNVGIKKRGGKEKFNAATVKKAFSQVAFK
jgi:hypothetical protein